MKKLCIIVPCYNEEASLPDSILQLSTLLTGMTGSGIIDASSFLLFVDDGSKDHTWETITDAAAVSPHIDGLRLPCNQGHQQALMAGLKAAVAQADITVTVDADLQDDIRMIPEMIRRYDAGSDIVCGVRRNRWCDTPFKRLTAGVFYRLMLLAGAPLIADHADFRLMSRRAVSLMTEKYRDGCLFLRGAVMQLGLPVATVSYDRLPRTAGTTKFPLRKMLLFAIDGIMQEGLLGSFLKRKYIRMRLRPVNDKK